MKVIVVGTSHGGFESVRTLLQMYPDADIKLFEQGDTVSFLSCGIQLYLEGTVKDINALHYATPESYHSKGVDVYTNHQVISLDADAKKVQVKDLKNNTVSDESYDKLILSPGAVPVSLPLPGSDLDNIFYLRGRDWAAKNKAALEDPHVRNVVVVGSGYIGIELVEAFAKAGKKVTVIDIFDRILNTYLDHEFTDRLTSMLEDKGVTVKTGESVMKFLGDNGKVTEVKTDKGTYPVDLVIEAAGVKPSTEWLKGSLDLSPKGIIITDEYQRTSAPDVFAAGDACTVKYAPTDGEAYIALATNARRQGTVAVMNLEKPTIKFQAVSGTSGLTLFDYKFATTGMKADTGNKDFPTTSAYVVDQWRPKFMEENEDIYMKITYETATHRIVGGQLMSKHDITASINTLSLAIQTKMTLEQLAFADFFFQPEFDQQWNYLNWLAKEALLAIK